MNYISFSLYGDRPMYAVGAIENAKFINSNLKDWEAVFYCSNDVPESVIHELQKWGAIVRRQDSDWHANGMFWRFQAIWDLEFCYLIFRDTDSRITDREISAVHDWQKSGMPVHIMRDHPYHGTLILGGMWGVSHEAKSILPDAETMKLFGVGHGQDQFYLADFVYPRIKNSVYVNDSFFNYEKLKFPFPISRQNGEYVGESLNEFGISSQTLRLLCIKVEKSLIRKFYLKIKSFLTRK